MTKKINDKETDNKHVGPTLEFQELVTALKLIDIGIQRGVYQANELVMVGTIHEKISKFLEYQAKVQQLAAQAQAAAEAKTAEKEMETADKDGEKNES